MKHSSRAPIAISSFDLKPPAAGSTLPMLACPDCGTDQPLKRGMIHPHHVQSATGAGKTARCPGSAQLVTVDTAHNGRAPLKLSTLKVHEYSVTGTVRPLVVCPDCDTHRVLKNGMIHPHRPEAAAEAAPCPGSGQRITIDVAPEIWAIAYTDACDATEKRRAKRTMVKPLLPAPTPLHHIAAAR